MKTWLEMLLSCESGGRSAEGRIPKPKYLNVYEVEVQHFEAEVSSNKFQMCGRHRMCVTSDDVKFFAVKSSAMANPICFKFKLGVRGCTIDLSDQRIFNLKVGKSTVSGSGVLVMKCNDDEISTSIRDTMYQSMSDIVASSGSSGRGHRYVSITSC
jgi:hypothetical protein